MPATALSRAAARVVESDGDGMRLGDQVWARLEALPDPRSPQGRIYPLASLIPVALCGLTAAGHDRLTGIGQWYQGRQIVVASRALHDIQTRNRAQQNDPHWNHRYDRRAGIEGAISEAVRAFGLRRTRHIALARTAVGHVLTARAINATRIADWTEHSNQPARPRSPSP